MKVAITGGTGFVGSHLAERFEADEVVKISRRTGVSLDDVDALTRAFEGCDVVAHCAGINRELGDQTYHRVHIDGTLHVVEAAKRAGVKKITMTSFLRARPNCGSPYHESKWTAEEIIRSSGLDYTIFKAGMIYGHGDHMLDHLSHLLYTEPVVPTVGLRPKTIRPVPISEMVDVAEAAVRGRLSRQTVSVVGGEELLLAEAVRRIAAEVHRPVVLFPLPVWTQTMFAYLWEATMKVPLAARAQVRILSEGVTKPAPWADELPEDLRPKLPFSHETISAGLPEPGRFGLHDLLFFR